MLHEIAYMHDVLRFKKIMYHMNLNLIVFFKKDKALTIKRIFLHQCNFFRRKDIQIFLACAYIMMTLFVSVSASSQNIQIQVLPQPVIYLENNNKPVTSQFCVLRIA